ncbi:hypothetical protein Tco_0445089 [Tanacetum coccineum]
MSFIKRLVVRELMPERGVRKIGMPGPMDGANAEANLRGRIGLSKWASIFVIIGFSLAPPDVAPSYPS